MPPAVSELANAGFDAPAARKGSVPGWTSRGDEFGRADVVASTQGSSPQAVELKVLRPGSTGDRSFMIFQVLDPVPYRGRKVRFGASVREAGAGVNLVLYTPQGMANSFDGKVRSESFRERSATLDVPKNASLLTFGIQVFGREGDRAWVDDAFVRIEDAAKGVAAEVRVRARKPRHVIDDRIFGMHIEWVEDGNGLLEKERDRFRDAVLERLRPLRIPVFRFPGGIHADYYDWRLGNGLPAKRGTSKNVFTGKTERHRFGSPELAALLQGLGSAALITANYGQGTPELAAEWARELRTRGVDARLWEVGNEIYLSDPKADAPNGRAIYHPGENYARDFPRFRRAIQSALPEAQVGIIAHLDDGAFPLAPRENRDWTERMLGKLDARADFVAVHDAYAPVIIDDSRDLSRAEVRALVYRALLAAPEQTRENLRAVGRWVDSRSPKNRGVPLAVTEFGPLFGISGRPERHAEYVDHSRTLAAALYVASLLHVFVDDPRVFLAAYTNPIHRWYGSLLTDTDQGLITTPSWHVYEMYRTRFAPQLVETEVRSPVFDSPRVGLVRAASGVAELIAQSSLGANGKRLAVMLVNRSLEHPLETRIVVEGFRASQADCLALTAPTPNALNGPALTRSTVANGRVAPRALPCTASDGQVRLSAPAHSLVSVVLMGQADLK